MVHGHLLARFISFVQDIPFFFVYCRMRFLILGRSVGKEKKKKKNWERSLELGGRCLSVISVEPGNNKTLGAMEDGKSMSWLNSSENSEKRMNHQN